MNTFLKVIFFALFVKPMVFLGLGLNLRGKENLPLQGPAIIAANHNSHLDTLVLMSLYPLSVIHNVRPVAAEDYFLKNRFLAWFSLNIIGIIPLKRTGRLHRKELFKECHRALDKGYILLIFPEGSRGKPEELTELKRGIHYLIKDRKETRITPVVLRGLGLALPKGEALLVPFNCDVIVDRPLENCASSKEFLSRLLESYNRLFTFCITKSKQQEDRAEIDEPESNK